MQAYRKISLFPIVSALTLLLTGCRTFQEPLEVVLKPDSSQQQSNAISKRFLDAAPKGQTVVDSAVELSKRNAELLEQMTTLREQNQELAAENHELKKQIAALEPELEQAKRELNEANDLLIEMRVELNNWKADVLGFRNEIRDADKAQLTALIRILEVLGGEVKPAPGEAEGAAASEEQNQGSTTVSPNEQNETESRETNISGEPSG